MKPTPCTHARWLSAVLVGSTPERSTVGAETTRIVADDVGVTVTRVGCRPVLVPWSNVLQVTL